MQWRILLSTMNWISRVVYITLIAYYLGLALLTTLLIVRQSINRLILIASRSCRPLPSHTVSLSSGHSSAKITRFLNTNLLVNNVLATCSMSFSFVLITALPLQTSARLISASIIVSVIPYLWGFFRATGVGINSGSIGAMLGLFWLAAKDPNLIWWEQVSYFLLLNLVANLSGWLGGFLGIGQIREAIVAGIFEIEIGEGVFTLSNLLSKVKKVIHDEFLLATTGKLIVSENKPTLVTAQTTSMKTAYSLVAGKQVLEWRRGLRPQLIALRWLFEKDINIHSTNEIIDYVFNVWRYITTELIINYPPYRSSTGPRAIQLITLTYSETPSIVWVDSETEQVSLKIYKRIRDLLTPPTHTKTELSPDEVNTTSKRPLTGAAPSQTWSILSLLQGWFRLFVPRVENTPKRKQEPGYHLRDFYCVTLRYWQPKVRLEQYSKNTVATIGADTFTSGKQIDNTLNVPIHLLDECVSKTTFFDKIRGRTSTFIAFFLSQVVLGLLINWLSDQLAP